MGVEGSTAAGGPSNGAGPAVDCLDLTHRYGERLALDAIRFQVRPREVFVLLGPNGGGKSTLFRILSTLLAPTGGTARVFGADVRSKPDAVRRAIGVLFQAPGLDGKLTVRENLMHHGHLWGLRGAALASRMDQVLERLAVRDRAGDRAEDLSGGLRRRVEVAKALLSRPRLLLLDEPSTGLDPIARRDLAALLRRLRDEEGVTVLLTTHLLDEAEASDRLAILDQGRLVALGAPEDLRRQVGGEVVTLRGGEPSAMAREVRERLGVEPRVLDDQVRIECAGGHALAARLVEVLGPRLDSVTVGRPTVEDVFVRATGRRLDGPGAAGGG
ncbi:MAG: ABC transporter ATP-binding protein [Planctomycetes bacterium]|nr:ABC transporter ATP-binding protein [Planctomycetota bacterium]